MGFCREPFGRVSVESRRESFIVHWGATPSGAGLADLRLQWDENPHPEFPNEDLDDLISALVDFRDGRRKE